MVCDCEVLLGVNPIWRLVFLQGRVRHGSLSAWWVVVDKVTSGFLGLTPLRFKMTTPAVRGQWRTWETLQSALCMSTVI